MPSLSISEILGIIESHGGKIWIDRNYTHGTSIKFTLPITGGA
jgi:signal transduction histidine kinase